MTKKDVLNYLIEKFPDNHVFINERLFKYKNREETKITFEAYVDNTVLGENSWSSAFSTLGKLWKYLKEKLEK